MRIHVLTLAAAVALPLGIPTALDAQSRPSTRFEGMDTDRDGVITREEWRGSDRSFRVHDWNGDGRLSGDEVRPGGVRRRAADENDFDDERYREFDDWTPESFQSHDHDRNGRITRDEWHYDRETFNRADQNRDGVVSRNEFLDLAADADREDRFEYLDVNGNGRIERSEWHGSRDAFQWLDRNRDGVLNRAEVLGDEGESAPTDTFADLDINRDGRVSREEWHWSRRSFEQRDLNNDGVLTRAELGSAATDRGRSDAVGTSGQRILVNATERWVDTGIDVRAGDTISLEAEGTITLSLNGNDEARPSGATSGRRAADAPLRDQPAGALIARIGDSAPVFVGARGTIDRAPVNGRLYLGVNDDHLPDNRGEYQAIVTIRRRE